MWSRKRKLLACLLMEEMFLKETEDKEQLRRTKKRKPDFDSENSTDEDDDNGVDESSVQEAVTDNPCSENETEPALDIFYTNIKTEPIDETVETLPQQINIQSGSSSCTNCINIKSQFENIQSEIKTLKETVKKQNKSLLGHLAEIRDLITEEDTLTKKCTTMAEFYKLETFLNDPLNKKRFVRQVSLFGGSTCRVFLQNALRHILADEIAKKFSLCGKGRIKSQNRPFESTKVYEILTVACGKLYDTSISRMRKAVSDWLNHAKERISRR